MTRSISTTTSDTRATTPGSTPAGSRVGALATALLALSAAFGVCGTAAASAAPADTTTDHATAATQAAATQAPGSSGAPTPAARTAGITSEGGAFMGWSSRGVAGTRAPHTASAAPQTAEATTAGIDVSHYQGNLNWPGYYSSGNRFAYMKATEGTTYRDTQFNTNYTNSYNAGFIRGAYHFARPDVSTGATQASYFIAHGGGWSADGKTLPGALDIEYNPYGATCYGKSASSMVSWIQDFVGTYHSTTGRYPVIYSTFDWWSTCTGNSGALSANSPFWIARYGSSVGTLPRGVAYDTIWQYTSSPLDKDTFNGDLSRVRALALG